MVIGNIRVRIVDMLFTIMMGADLDNQTIRDINDIINRINRLRI